MSQWERWPANRVRVELLTFPQSPQVFTPAGRMMGLRQVPVLMITRERDHGVPYTMQPGCWRDYAEALNPPGLGQMPADTLLDRLRVPVQRFVRDFGPPAFINQDHQPFDSGLWMFSRDLLALARLWTPGDNEGLSHWQGAPTPKAETEARGVIHWFHTWLADSQSAPPEGSLAELMVSEALRFTEQHLAMRRCKACDHWFAPTRSDQTYCGANCRKRFSRQQQEI